MYLSSQNSPPKRLILSQLSHSRVIEERKELSADEDLLDYIVTDPAIVRTSEIDLDDSQLPLDVDEEEEGDSDAASRSKQGQTNEMPSLKLRSQQSSKAL